LTCSISVGFRRAPYAPMAMTCCNFARWWAQAAPGPLSELNESTLLDYVRYQLDQHPKPTAQTINHRLTALRNLYRFHYQREIPSRNRFLKHFCYPQPLRLRKAGHACGWPAIEGASAPRGSSLVPAGRRVLAQLSHFSRPQLPSTLFKPPAGLLRRPDCPSRRRYGDALARVDCWKARWKLVVAFISATLELARGNGRNQQRWRRRRSSYWGRGLPAVTQGAQ